MTKNEYEFIYIHEHNQRFDFEKYRTNSPPYNIMLANEPTYSILKYVGNDGLITSLHCFHFEKQ